MEFCFDISEHPFQVLQRSALKSGKGREWVKNILCINLYVTPEVGTSTRILLFRYSASSGQQKIAEYGIDMASRLAVSGLSTLNFQMKMYRQTVMYTLCGNY